MANPIFELVMIVEGSRKAKHGEDCGPTGKIRHRIPFLAYTPEDAEWQRQSWLRHWRGFKPVSVTARTIEPRQAGHDSSRPVLGQVL